MPLEEGVLVPSVRERCLVVPVQTSMNRWLRRGSGVQCLRSTVRLRAGQVQWAGRGLAGEPIILAATSVFLFPQSLYLTLK